MAINTNWRNRNILAIGNAQCITIIYITLVVVIKWWQMRTAMRMPLFYFLILSTWVSWQYIFLTIIWIGFLKRSCIVLTTLVLFVCIEVEGSRSSFQLKMYCLWLRLSLSFIHSFNLIHFLELLLAWNKANLILFFFK